MAVHLLMVLYNMALQTVYHVYTLLSWAAKSAWGHIRLRRWPATKAAASLQQEPDTIWLSSILFGLLSTSLRLQERPLGSLVHSLLFSVIVFLSPWIDRYVSCLTQHYDPGRVQRHVLTHKCDQMHRFADGKTLRDTQT